MTAYQDEMDLLYLYGDKERSLPLSTVSKVVWGQKTVSSHSLCAVKEWQVTQNRTSYNLSNQQENSLSLSCMSERV